MSKSKRQGKLDLNHRAICNVWRDAGWSVMETTAQANGVDTIISGGGLLTTIVEIKRREKCIGIKQIELLANWKGNAAIVCDERTAIKMLANLAQVCLTSAQKSRLLAFCAAERLAGATDKKEYAVNRILKMIE